MKTKKQRGLGLILVIFISTSLLAVIAAASRMLVISLQMQKAEAAYTQAFYRAEAGIEYAKYKISTEPNWCTDLPHSPAKDKKWVQTQAWGLKMNGFKMVKEKGKNRLYSFGFSGGTTLNPAASVIIYLEYSYPPLKPAYWEEL